MKNLKNIIIILLVLAITGKIRMPIEQKLAEELHSHKLVPPRLSLEERSRLKQKAFIATYGSLRPTIAAFMSSASVSLHTNLEWDKIEKQFEEIILLDPYNYFYWETASWHMATNAAGNKKNDSNLTDIAKKRIFEKYIQKGREIVDRGIKVNPDNWKFIELKAKMLADRYRNPEYAKAIEINKQLLKRDDIPKQIERIINIKVLAHTQQFLERHQELYEIAISLFQRGGQYRTPVVLNQLFVSQNHPLTIVQSPMTIIEIYGSEREALRHLTILWKGGRTSQKLYGVEDTIRNLEQILYVPINNRIFPHTPLFMK